MGTILLNFNQNPNIGLYAFVTDKFALVGREVDANSIKEMERILKVPIHQISIAGTSLIGVFLAGDENLVLVPSIVFDNELKALEELKIPFQVFKTDLTCLGNNMYVGKHGILMSSEFTSVEEKEIEKIFDRPVQIIDIADSITPGACLVVNGDKGLIHRDASSQEIKLVEKTLKIKIEAGTINMGVPHIKSGLINNSNGLIIGHGSGPAEIMNAEESLGYIEG
jgi:translation initiation factor 6